MVSEGLELWVWLSSREQSEKQRLVCLVNRQEAMLIQIKLDATTHDVQFVLLSDYPLPARLG
ncbi:hypothetical protein [Synechococcus sp. CS-197]|uniref:hypothetical protein n=1 Tax=Synechococcus sp. CS-197 TaxID=2847985 RepID=UPI0001525698|nr:hypothetical protein [Synechococcus sp. CS-197]CAK23441.1 Conserved hypothetical protein [Synechococcus sp. WH 7803]